MRVNTLEYLITNQIALTYFNTLAYSQLPYTDKRLIHGHLEEYLPSFVYTEIFIPIHEVFKKQ